MSWAQGPLTECQVSHTLGQPGSPDEPAFLPPGLRSTSPNSQACFSTTGHGPVSGSAAQLDTRCWPPWT